MRECALASLTIAAGEASEERANYDLVIVASPWLFSRFPMAGNGRRPAVAVSVKSSETQHVVGNNPPSGLSIFRKMATFLCQKW